MDPEYEDFNEEAYDSDYQSVYTDTPDHTSGEISKKIEEKQNSEEKEEFPGIPPTVLSRIYASEEDVKKNFVQNTTVMEHHPHFMNKSNNETMAADKYWTQSYEFWLVCEVVTYMMICVNVHIIMSLIIYHIRQGGLVRRGVTATPKGRKYSILLNVLMLLTILFTLIRLILDLDTVWGRSSKVNCVTLKPTKIVSAFLGLGTIYALFWARQRIFYNNPILKQMSNKFTRFLSLWIFAPLLLLYLANLLYFMLDSPKYKALPPNGCSVSVNMTPWYLLAVTAIIMQILLLGLFVYPLLKSKRNPRRVGGKAQSFMDLIKKVFIIACLAVFCCITALIIITFTPTKTDKLSLFVIDVNLTLLVFFGLAQFVDWRDRVFPCKQSSRKSSFSGSE